MLLFCRVSIAKWNCRSLSVLVYHATTFETMKLPTGLQGKLPAMESLVIFASQNAVSIWESSTSDSFPGWDHTIPSGYELVSSRYFQSNTISIVVLTIAWLLAGLQYRGLYDSKFMDIKWSFQEIIDLTNQQFINMANIVLLSSFVLLASLHKVYPIEEVTLHFIAMYTFIVGFRTVYFVYRWNQEAKWYWCMYVVNGNMLMERVNGICGVSWRHDRTIGHWVHIHGSTIASKWLITNYPMVSNEHLRIQSKRPDFRLYIHASPRFFNFS